MFITACANEWCCHCVKPPPSIGGCSFGWAQGLTGWGQGQIGWGQGLTGWVQGLTGWGQGLMWNRDKAEVTLHHGFMYRDILGH